MEEPTELDLPPPPDHAEVLFHPPLLIAAAMLVGAVARRAFPAPFLPAESADTLGAVVLGLAFILFAWSVFAMWSGGTSIPPHRPSKNVVVSGPYRFSRNPIYLAMLLVLVGMGARANSAWFLLLAVVSAGLLWWGVISREERYLERKFGTAYLEYKSRVRRWI